MRLHRNSVATDLHAAVEPDLITHSARFCVQVSCPDVCCPLISSRQVSAQGSSLHSDNVVRVQCIATKSTRLSLLQSVLEFA